MSGTKRRVAGPVLLPLIDRLIDEAPERATDSVRSSADAMAVLAASVRRDLEMLLNARRRFRSWPSSMGELDTSPLGFGLPDCSGGGFGDARMREAYRAEVEATIRRFEPRFLSVSVSLPEFDSRKATPTLRLRIEALLHADPAPEAISFETVVDAVTSEVTIWSAEG